MWFRHAGQPLETPHRSAGFTLLELLISIVIVALILSIMFGSLRLGIRAWERGEKDIDRDMRLRIVKSMMQRQIASLSTEALLNLNSGLDRIPFMLVGQEDSIQFLTNYSILPGTMTTPVYARFFMKDRSDLAIIEKEIMTLTYPEVELLGEDHSSYVLLSGIEELKFEYLENKTTGAAEWKTTWNMGLKKTDAFPLAVKVDFVYQETSVSFIIKIMSEFTEEKADKA